MSIVLAGNPAWAGTWAGDTQMSAMTSDVMAGSESEPAQWTEIYT